MAADEKKILGEIKDAVFALGYRFGAQWLLISTKIRFRVDGAITQTMAASADGFVFVNPGFWASVTPANRVALLAHEFLHPTMRHFDRAVGLGLINAKGEPVEGMGENLRTWNIACDMAINPLIEAAGMTLPPNGCFPPAEYKGPRDAESIYHWLRSQKPPGGGKGQAPEDSRGDAQPAEGCGVLPNQEPKGQAQGADASGRQPTGGATDWDQVAQQARALALNGKQAGRGSQAFADALAPVPPRVPWRKVLGSGFSIANAQRGKERPTYAKISRRGSTGGICRPGWIQTSPRMAVVIDVSGSMDREWVSQIVEEIKRLVSVYPGAECYVISHTDRIVWEGWIKAGSESALTGAVAFTGGTDPDPAYDRVRELGRLDCIVHFTDCEFAHAWPEPSARLIVGAFGTGGSAPYTRPPEGAKLIPCTDGRASA